ncbi:MAG: hypothetical protein J6S40_09765 [Thermoguttaceae bacterium]|nr:hypothetical protein [Thermoguttaceae bacterium]
MVGMKRIFFFVIAAAALMSVRFPLWGADPQAESIKKAALESWDRYAEFITCCEATVRSHEECYDETGSLAENDDWESEMICVYPNYVRFSHGVGKESATVRGWNREYSFALERPNEDAPWEIDGEPYAETPNSVFSWNYLDSWYKEGELQLNWRDFRIFHVLTPQMNTVMMPLPVLFGDPHFEITEIREFTEDGTRKITLSFEYEPNFLSIWSMAHKGEITLLPDHDWMPDSMKLFLVNVDGEEFGPDAPVEFDSRLEARLEYDYQYRMPVLTRYSREIHNLADDRLKTKVLDEYTVRPISRFKYRAKRFTQSYYGLPEPDFVKPNWPKYIITLLGVALILTGVWRMLMKNKAKRIEV